jgi:choline kinase
MKAVLLAAGLGSRLSKYTQETPKCLVQIGHTNILVHTLRSLLEIGIEEVIIATGHCHEKIDDCVARQFDGQAIRLVHNPEYLKGSGSSLKRAINGMHGAALILEADLICHIDILRRFVHGPASNAIAIGDYGHDRIEGRVELSDGFVRSITMRDAAADPVAWVGITRLSALAVESIRGSLNSRQADGANNSFPYSDHISWLVQQHDFVGIGIDDLPWIEVDTEEDLIRANAIVYPKLYPGAVHGS